MADSAAEPIPASRSRKALRFTRAPDHGEIVKASHKSATPTAITSSIISVNRDSRGADRTVALASSSGPARSSTVMAITAIASPTTVRRSRTRATAGTDGAMDASSSGVPLGAEMTNVTAAAGSAVDAPGAWRRSDTGPRAVGMT